MKDATVSARVEYDIKTEAEDILQQLGIPVSVLINSLYRQIIYRHGIPFSLTIPATPKTIDTMTQAELDMKFQHSYEQSLPENADHSMRFLMNWKGALLNGAL
ncbi:MAG TPA: type II toxin-antitoxin system antitoxin, RelB/DinJ family [Lachnospiraceae bacterium]|nr:type II toxin-antitoxin system antitoxin, RelB/DinJ family [Lachnospiraceae bacterium]